MARPRLAKHKDMPDNCYPLRVGRTTYYRYRHPHTGKFSSLGKERSAALRAARILNARLLSTPTAEQLVARVIAPRMPFSAYVDRYLNTILPARRSKKGEPLAPNTLKMYRSRLGVAVEQIGALDVTTLTRRDIALYLDKLGPTARANHRSLLSDVFTHVVAEGLREDNPVERTLAVTVTVMRRRLTLEEFQKLRAAAEPWFQLALDIALITLQRREDIAGLATDDLRDGYLWVVQGKTGAHIRIAYKGTPLESILAPFAAADRDSGVPLINRPGRQRRKTKATRAELLAWALTTEFARLWEQEIGERDGTSPTFHEIRALGARLYKDRGIDPQGLLGHTDARTTRIYLDRHQVQWTEVEIPG